MNLVVMLDRLLTAIDRAEREPESGRDRCRIEARHRYLNLRERLEALDNVADRAEKAEP